MTTQTSPQVSDTRQALEALFDRPDRNEWTDAEAADKLAAALRRVLDLHRPSEGEEGDPMTVMHGVVCLVRAFRELSRRPEPWGRYELADLADEIDAIVGKPTGVAVKTSLDAGEQALAVARAVLATAPTQETP